MTTVPPDPGQGHGWRKSSYSGEKQDCVEVLDLDDGSRLVRDSKNPTGPVHHFTASEWDAFLMGVKDGEFD